MVFEEITKYAKPAAFILGGGVALYAGSELPGKARSIAFAVGGASIAYGLWSIYSIGKEAEIPPNPITEGDVSVTIDDPAYGEDWSVYRPHTINITLVNRTDERKYLYLNTYITNPRAEVEEKTPEYIVLSPAEVKKVSYYFYPLPALTGSWAVTAVLSDKPVNQGGLDKGRAYNEFKMSYL